MRWGRESQHLGGPPQTTEVRASCYSGRSSGTWGGSPPPSEVQRVLEGGRRPQQDRWAGSLPSMSGISEATSGFFSILGPWKQGVLRK